MTPLVRYPPLKFFLTCLVIFFCNGCCGRADHDSECTAIGEHGHSDHALLPDATAASMDRYKAVFEQKFYLHKLFDQYGENGTLTVEGLEKLLCNIGVGRVRTMETKHEHFDHVSKKHTISAEGTIHHHCCPECRHIRLRIGLQTTPKVTHKETEIFPKPNDLFGGNMQRSPGTTPQSEISAGDKSGSKRHARPIRSPPSAIPATTDTYLTDGLKVQLATTDSYSTSTVGQALAEYSTHKDVKEVQRRNNPLENHSDKVLKGEEQCLNADKLLSSHGIHPQTTLNAEQFGYLCPALLDQIDSKACITHETGEKRSVYSTGAVWIGGFVSVTVISLLSLLGIIFMPLMNKLFFKFLLTFLVALAVGTLSGDAFLHLLPHSQGVHHHGAEQRDHAVEDQDHLDSVWKGLTALGGLYLMFLIEHLITLIKLYKDKKKQKKCSQEEQEVDIDKNLEIQESPQLSKDENLDLKQFADPDDSLVESKDQSNLHSLDHSQNSLTPEQEVMIAHAHPEGNYNTYVPRGCENKCHSHFHDTIGNADDSHHHHHDYHHILHHHHHQNHHPHSHCHYYFQEELKDAGIATLAWMVIMGDGLHNFSDGLAIGAAFTGGLSSGLSTSVAVFCHELPHELGDFAVLLKAGMTVKQAILYNVLSALLGYLGMIIGIAIGHYAENVTTWIFAATAGLFLYMALVDMVPEMLHGDAGDHDYSHGAYFLLQNAGMLLGFGIMLLIAVFEHKILSAIRL